MTDKAKWVLGFLLLFVGSVFVGRAFSDTASDYRLRDIDGVQCIIGPNGALSCDWEATR